MTRGTKDVNAWFKSECNKRFPVKGWHHLACDNSVIWCGVKYLMRRHNGVV